MHKDTMATKTEIGFRKLCGSRLRSESVSALVREFQLLDRLVDIQSRSQTLVSLGPSADFGGSRCGDPGGQLRYPE